MKSFLKNWAWNTPVILAFRQTVSMIAIELVLASTLLKNF
jgi:hypothetical protein